MNDRPSEMYYCNSKGCFNGYGSAFTAAPTSWFADRGMTPPKNCPDCRRWIKAQGDEGVRCVSCNRTMRLSARLKISHHKRTGPWALPDECRQCERGERPPRSAKVWKTRTARQQKKTTLFTRLPINRYPQSYAIDVNPASYDHPLPRGAQTRREHIEIHTEWSPHSKTKSNNGDRDPTALDVQGNELGTLLRSVNIVTQTQDLDRVREYLDTKYGRVVRLTLTDTARIEVTVIESNPGTNGHRGHELVTTYDGYTVGQVQGKLRSGEWR